MHQSRHTGHARGRCCRSARPARSRRSAVLSSTAALGLLISLAGCGGGPPNSSEPRPSSRDGWETDPGAAAAPQTPATANPPALPAGATIGLAPARAVLVAHADMAQVQELLAERMAEPLRKIGFEIEPPPADAPLNWEAEAGELGARALGMGADLLVLVSGSVAHADTFGVFRRSRASLLASAYEPGAAAAIFSAALSREGLRSTDEAGADRNAVAEAGTAMAESIARSLGGAFGEDVIAARLELTGVDEGTVTTLVAHFVALPGVRGTRAVRIHSESRRATIVLLVDSGAEQRVRAEVAAMRAQPDTAGATEPTASAPNGDRAVGP